MLANNRLVRNIHTNNQLDQPWLMKMDRNHINGEISGSRNRRNGRQILYHRGRRTVKQTRGTYREMNKNTVHLNAWGKEKVVEFLETNNILSSQQHGFRKKRSTVTQLLRYMEKICNAVGEEVNFDTVYLDFAKAFDKANYGIAPHRMKEVGIDGRLGIWLYSFLTDRAQEIIANNEISEKVGVKSGVPQGSILGPVIFLIMIDSITELDEENHLDISIDTLKFENHPLLPALPIFKNNTYTLYVS